MATILYASIVTVSILQSILALIFIVGLIFRLRKSKFHVCIIVLGDIGRSPRMQYHAKSLISEGYTVSFVGYPGSSPINFLRDNDKVSFFYLRPCKWSFLPGFLNYIAKAAFTSIYLMFVLLFKVSIPSFYLVQNPPTIPSLMVVWLMTCINGATMITDWHNYGFTILSINLKSRSHILVRFAKWFEGFFGHFSHKNICVTEAMKSDLLTKWKIEAETLYDKPPEQFNEIQDKNVKTKLFKKMINSDSFKEFQNHKMWKTLNILVDETSQRSVDTPAVLVSSTSWTEDEDFSILLNALLLYEKEIVTQRNNLPKLVCIITGKGPMKEFYKEKIRKLNLINVLITTPWLEAEDYPKVVASGDLGISLHYSSSGLDLPMKVVDMFGCCLPVCAINFSCLGELVKHEINGLTFMDAKELSLQMVELLSGFPHENRKLNEMRANLRSNSAKNRWHENWKHVMLPLLKN